MKHLCIFTTREEKRILYSLAKEEISSDYLRPVMHKKKYLSAILSLLKRQGKTNEMFHLLRNFVNSIRPSIFCNEIYATHIFYNEKIEMLKKMEATYKIMNWDSYRMKIFVEYDLIKDRIENNTAINWKKVINNYKINLNNELRKKYLPELDISEDLAPEEKADESRKNIKILKDNIILHCIIDKSVDKYEFRVKSANSLFRYFEKSIRYLLKKKFDVDLFILYAKIVKQALFNEDKNFEDVILWIDKRLKFINTETYLFNCTYKELIFLGNYFTSNLQIKKLIVMRSMKVSRILDYYHKTKDQSILIYFAERKYDYKIDFVLNQLKITNETIEMIRGEKAKLKFEKNDFIGIRFTKNANEVLSNMKFI